KAPIEVPKTADNMTVEEKVAQMLMVRCDDSNKAHILSLKPGGIVMFGVDFDGLDRNMVISKTDGYKSALDIEPFIAVDEEGGTVVRVSSNPKLAPEKYQSPRYYYDMGGLDAVLSKELEKSELLASLGITMNLAPVADISTDPNYFMYDRSLG
ncbi:MAG: beta-hexosaminidase, partial [Clostridia bacterium]|nr:beta-hexosaminidase [Clostridia bacterium]